MADNVTLQNVAFATPPPGTTIATDTIGGIAYQRVKVVWGVDGVAGDVAAGNGLPVAQDGAWTVAATQSGTWNVTASGTVDATQSGTWNVGTVTTLTGITNVVHIDDNAGSLTFDYATTGSGNATGALRVELANNGTGVLATVGAVTAITNALPAGTNTIGKTYAAPQTTKALTNANVSASSSGENTLVSGTASQTIRVFAGSFTAASAVTLTFKDAASGNTLGTIPLAANGSFNFDTIASGEPLWVTASSGAFILSLSAAVAVSGFVQYVKS